MQGSRVRFSEGPLFKRCHSCSIGTALWPTPTSRTAKPEPGQISLDLPHVPARLLDSSFQFVLGFQTGFDEARHLRVLLTDAWNSNRLECPTVKDDQRQCRCNKASSDQQILSRVVRLEQRQPFLLCFVVIKWI
jgi:hypothetical protein